MANKMKVGLCEPSGKVTVNLRQQQGTRSRGRAHPELVQRHSAHTNEDWAALRIMEVGLSKHDLSGSLLVAKKYHGVTRSKLGNLRRYSSGLRDMYLSDRIGPKRLQPVAKPAC